MTPHPTTGDQAEHRTGEHTATAGQVGETTDTPPSCSVGLGELTDDPRTDPEALCLCALLWASPEAAQRVVGVLRAEDFHTPVYGQLFEMVRVAVTAGDPHDPVSVLGAITAAGTGPHHEGVLLARALTMVTAAGAGAEAAGHYALAVVRAAYRRGYATAAAAMTQAAAELGEDQLFAQLLTVGRERRTAAARLENLRAVLDPQPGQNSPIRPRGQEGSPP